LEVSYEKADLVNELAKVTETKKQAAMAVEISSWHYKKDFKKER